MTKVSVETLHDILAFDPVSGVLFYKPRRVEHFTPGKKSAEWQANAWNARFAGRRFGAKHHRGYIYGSVVSARNISAHSIVWAMCTGSWPSDVIDHINGDPSDNRIENLRCVTQELNARNIKVSKVNTSGVTGVSMDRGRWRACIRANGRRLNLGTFDNFHAAVAARTAAEIEHGYINRSKGYASGVRDTVQSGGVDQELARGSREKRMPGVQPLEKVAKQKGSGSQYHKEGGRTGLAVSPLRHERRGALR